MKRAVATGIGNLRVALQEQAPAGAIALCAAMPLPDGEVAEWVHLLPRGPRLDTFDSRGPYFARDLGAIVTASKEAAQSRGAVLDENHATDIAAPQGQPAPAAGWFDDFELRDDGIWGHVEWNARGKALMADRAYRGISPVIVHDASKNVVAIVRASLINKPNLKGLTALNMESDMELLALLAKKLGLAEGVAQDAVIAAVEALQGQQTALQGIAKAAGLEEGAVGEAILAEVTRLKALPAAAGAAATIEALQAELADVTKRFNTLDEATRRDKATAFVDGAIRDKRVGVSTLRDHYISMHMQDPARVEKEINAMPQLGRSGTEIVPPKRDVAAGELAPEQAQVASLLGIDPKTYAATLAAEGRAEAAA